MISVSESGQASGSSAPAPLYTSTIPLAKPTDPLNLEDISQKGDNWLLFKGTWQIYEQGTGISKQEGPVRVAHFLNVIGREGVQMFNTFTFYEASDESADNLDDILAKYESRCLPQRNETYERYLFNTREQEPGESIDQYCTAIMCLSEYCGFATLQESLIREGLIRGVKNDRARKKLLEQKDLTLDKALDILRTAELTKIRASEISTEEAYVNRVRQRKTKFPNSRTEDKKPHMQTMEKSRYHHSSPRKRSS